MHPLDQFVHKDIRNIILNYNNWENKIVDEFKKCFNMAHIISGHPWTYDYLKQVPLITRWYLTFYKKEYNYHISNNLMFTEGPRWSYQKWYWQNVDKKIRDREDRTTWGYYYRLSKKEKKETKRELRIKMGMNRIF